MTQWNYELAKEAAQKFTKKREFDRAFGGAYAWARRNGVLEEITSHMRKDTIWNKESALEKAKQFNNRSNFSKAYPGCVKWLRRYDLWEDACAHMDSKFEWTYELVKEEASKFSSRNEFHKHNASAAQWANRNGCMSELFPHQLSIWDFNSVLEEARKYSHREEFRVKAAGAAQWAARNGVWDDVCSHMDLAGKSDYDAVYVWKAAEYDTLYKVGVTSKRLGDRRIQYVANKFGLTVEQSHIADSDKALSVEQDMLRIGSPASISRLGNGYSEFREFSPIEYLKCLNLMGIETAST